MEDSTPVYNYLGEEMMQQHLVDITTSIQGCFPVGSDQFNNLAKYSKKTCPKAWEMARKDPIDMAE